MQLFCRKIHEFVRYVVIISMQKFLYTIKHIYFRRLMTIHIIEIIFLCFIFVKLNSTKILEHKTIYTSFVTIKLHILTFNGTDHFYMI